MANLNTKTISDGVGDILAVDGGIDASSARQIKDGDGTVSPFYITQSSVGVNVSPAETFHLKNTTGGNSECKFVMDGADMAIQIINATNTWTFGADNAPDRFVIADGTGLSSGEKLVIQADGKVGIGTVPDKLLHISSTSDAELHIEGGSDGSGNAYLLLDAGGDSDDSKVIFQKDGDSIGSIDYDHNSTETSAVMKFNLNVAGSAHPQMVIQADGKVGIGTDSPYSKLEVRDSGADVYPLYVNSTHASTPRGVVIDFSADDPDDQTQLFLYCKAESGGDVAKFKIFADGDYWSADGGAVNSDIRLKTDITDASSKLDDINKLKVRNFKWREKDSEANESIHSAESASKKRIGFIAQEFETVFPSLVSESILKEFPDDDSKSDMVRKGIKTTALIPILVKAIQELSAKVTALENA